MQKLGLEIWKWITLNLSVVDILLVAYVVETKWEMYQLRKRVAVLLDSKDDESRVLMEKTFNAVNTAKRITDLLERLMGRMK